MRTRMTKLEEATEIDADGLIGRKLDDHVGKFDNLSFDQFLSASAKEHCPRVGGGVDSSVQHFLTVLSSSHSTLTLR